MIKSAREREAEVLAQARFDSIMGISRKRLKSHRRFLRDPFSIHKYPKIPHRNYVPGGCAYWRLPEKFKKSRGIVGECALKQGSSLNLNLPTKDCLCVKHLEGVVDGHRACPVWQYVFSGNRENLNGPLVDPIIFLRNTERRLRYVNYSGLKPRAY